MMKKLLKMVPIASDVNNPKTHVELTKNISFRGNHILANILATLIIKQKPKEQNTFPTKKK